MNPRDWSGALWLFAKQVVIILFFVGLSAAACVVIWRAIITG